MTQDMEERIFKLLDEDEDAKKNLRGRIRLQDLPEPLQKEVVSIRNRHREEYLAQLERELDIPQLMLQSESHAEHLAIMQEAIRRDSMRLVAMASLKSMFNTSAGEKKD